MKYFVILVLLFSNYLLFSQDTPDFENYPVKVGSKFDINAIPFNGYFDPFTYSPSKKIDVVLNSDSYEVGRIYDLSGNKTEGLIKFENDKIRFRKGSEKKKTDIYTSEELSGLVIGVDSFFVSKDFYYKNRIKDKPEFLQFITEFNGYTFAKHYQFTSGLAQYYAMKSPIIETFLIKTKDEDVWGNFPDNKRFEETALKYFSHIPYLKEKITSGKYKSENMMSIIKMAEYFDKYQNSEKIYYDNYWQETRNKEAAAYYAKITDLQDSIWTFDYYKGNTKLYTAHYSSFYPHNKHGDFISYFPNGEKRQVIEYKYNTPKEAELYDTMGNLKTAYDIFEYKNMVTLKRGFKCVYKTINDSDGNNMLNTDKTLIINEEDRFLKATYQRVFSYKKMTSSTRMVNGSLVYQLTDPLYDFNINSLQAGFTRFMQTMIYDQALSVDAQGIQLLYLIIDDKGYVNDYAVLNSIHPELDKITHIFVHKYLLPGAKDRFRFKPYRFEKKKSHCEVVIPIEFIINRFYHPPVNYYHFNNWELYNQQLINNFTIPTNLTVPPSP